MNKYDILIVGAGLTGAVHAEQYASKGKKVLVIDERDHIAGNCYDYKSNNITVHKYGPHIFHTDSEEVWTYLSKFTKWHIYMHKVLAVIDGNLVPIPFNYNTLQKVFPESIANNIEKKLSKYEYGSRITIAELKKNEDKDLKFLADYIYEKVFKHYTMKQWGIPLEQLDSAVGSRVPIIINRNDNYFTDKYQGIPMFGYTKMIENILNHPNINVSLNTSFEELPSDIKYDKLVYTGKIDRFCEYKYGELQYRSLNLVTETHNLQNYQPVSTVNYPNNYDFTRITEFKHFLNEFSNETIIMKEYPQSHIINENIPYYPIIDDINTSLYKTYLTETCNNNVTFSGRLAEFKYYNMDQAVASVLNKHK